MHLKQSGLAKNMFNCHTFGSSVVCVILQNVTSMLKFEDKLSGPSHNLMVLIINL